MIGWLVTKQEMGLGEGGWGLLGETQTESRALLGGRALVSLKKSLSIVVKLRVLCRAMSCYINEQENTYDQLSTTLNFYIFLISYSSWEKLEFS